MSTSFKSRCLHCGVVGRGLSGAGRTCSCAIKCKIRNKWGIFTLITFIYLQNIRLLPVRRRNSGLHSQESCFSSPSSQLVPHLINPRLFHWPGFFVVMPTFPPVPEFPRPNISPQLSRTDSCCSGTQKCCWTFVTWLPITIVYGATLWAVYVNVYVISLSFAKGATGISSSVQVLTGQGCYSLVLGWRYTDFVYGLTRSQSSETQDLQSKWYPEPPVW